MMNKSETHSDVTAKINFAFFGSSELSVIVLEKLKSLGILPVLIITTKDKPKGRKLVITPPEAKLWATLNEIPYLQFQSLKKEEVESTIRNSSIDVFDFFVVASYSKMIPDNILNIPKHGTLNIHPSLLPQLRGPSPIISAILSLQETGVTIIKLDSEMDHGPILAQEKIEIKNWPPYEEDLEKVLAETGAAMLSTVFAELLNGVAKETEQDHSKATFCSKIEKKDGEINLNDKPDLNLRKIRAYHRWPSAFFFQNGKRIIIKKAKIENESLVIERVVPEGKKEMNYEDYLRGIRN